ncbi:MAG TPA: inositol monophosphatase family protein [Candidatus Nitrosopolaris sp.]|nr:inositol monophosphatase family protein [Candidatus Nitrosopolaris sp.]
MEGLTAPRIHPTLAAAEEAARAGGEVALGYYHGGFDVTLKPDQTPVTQADREAERAITSILGRRFPDCGFLGEEFGETGPTDRRWIIDPIDGTKNFVRHIPTWAVLIALEEQGEVTTGVAFNPVTGDLLSARKGDGAFANGERIHVSSCDRLADAMVLHSGLNILRDAGFWSGFERIVDAAGRTRGFGDYYGYDLVATGRAEVYLEADLKPWDIAAVKILVEEAGGRLTDFSGRSTIYGGTVLASNGRLHSAVLDLLTGR